MTALVVGATACTLQTRLTRRLRGRVDQNQYAFLDSVPVMAWAADSKGNCTFANRLMVEFTGVSSEKSLGHEWVNYIHPEDLQNCFDSYFSATQRAAPLHQIFRMRRADGEYRWILNSGLPSFDRTTRECMGYTGAMIDVTEQKQAEENWKKIAETQGLFIHESSSELKSPLTALYGHLLQMSRHIDQQSPASAMSSFVDELERAKIRSKKIAALVDQMVDFSDINHLAAEFDPQNCDLVQIIHEAQQLFSDDNDNEELPILIETGSNLVGRFDSSLMTRVVWNLLSLVSEFDRPRRIEVVARASDPRRATLKILAKPQNVTENHNDGFTKKIGRDVFKLRIQLAEKVISIHGGSLSWQRHDLLGTRILIELPLHAEFELNAAVR